MFTSVPCCASVSLFGLSTTGANFGNVDLSVSSSIGATVCQTSSWLSSSIVRCLVDRGVSGSHTVRVSGGTGLSGTVVGAFSYDAPLLTHSSPFNGALSSSTTLSISGTNFLTTATSVIVQVGDSACGTSSWVSQTSVTCVMNEGSGRRQRVALTIEAAVGCRERSFSFDAPAILSIIPAASNGAGTGGATLTIQGNNFGTTSSTVTVSIGPTPCTTSTWISNTALRCTTPGGAGTQEIRVEVSSQIGTAVRAFSFDSNVLTATSATNAPTTGGQSFMLYGLGFGAADTSPSVRLGSSSCLSATWNSLSSVQCSPAPGTGGGHTITTTIDGLTGMQVGFFSYDAPIVTSLNALSGNGPLSGGSSVSIFGLNFGAVYGLGATATIGGTACDTNWWVADSTVVCKTSGPGVGSGRIISMELQGVTGTLISAFTYNSPVITSPLYSNGPSTAGVHVTVSGTEFGTLNLTPTVRVGKTRCMTSSWISSTTIRCDVAPGVGATVHIGASLFDHQATAALAGTLSSVFTYDAPMMTAVGDGNAPVTGGSVTTLSGMNFGAEDYCSSARLGSTACAKTSFVSETVMRCLIGAGDGLGRDVALTVNRAVGCSTSLFSYDAPVLTAALRPNLPTTMGGYVTLLGINFGQTDLSASASVVRLETSTPHFCSTTSWMSSTTFKCGYDVVTSQAIDYDTTATSAVYKAEIGTFGAVFSFDAPVLLSATPVNIPPSGGGTLSLIGANFIARDFSPSVRIGSTACATSSWVSISSVLCKTEPGTGAYHSVVLTLADRIGSKLSAFSYNGAYDLNTPSPTFSTPVTLSPSDSPTPIPTIVPSADYCSGIVVLGTMSGTITDGSGSGSYASDSDCTWLIQTNTAITLSFPEFDVETSYDTMKV